MESILGMIGIHPKEAASANTFGNPSEADGRIIKCGMEQNLTKTEISK